MHEISTDTSLPTDWERLRSDHAAVLRLRADLEALKKGTPVAP